MKRRESRRCCRALALALALMLMSGMCFLTRAEESTAVNGAETTAETGEAAAAETAGEETFQGTVFRENEWNFVEDAMDISGGIPAGAGGVLGSIREAGVLRVITEPYFAPQEFLDPALEGQEAYVGADMELARLIAQKMGVDLEIIPMDFHLVLTAVAEGKGDLAISALSYTPGRAGTNELSKGYYFAESEASTGIMIRAEDAENIVTLEDLKDKILVAQSGSLQESMMAENVRYYQEFRRLSTVNDLYAALIQGRADAAAVDMETAREYLETEAGKNLMLVEGISFSLEEAFKGDRIAGKKGELELIYFVNGVINEVLESGIYTRWMEEARQRADELGL